MRKIKLSTAANLMVILVASSDHITGLAGATLTITASKDGAAFGAITPTVTDRGSGWYNLALTASHTDTLNQLALHITAASADPIDLSLEVVAYDPTAATNLGLTNLDIVLSTRAEAWTTAITEAYAADGAAATPAQLLYMLWSSLSEFAISGTTITAKKLDGSTTSMTFTLDSATAPASRTRAS